MVSKGEYLTSALAAKIFLSTKKYRIANIGWKPFKGIGETLQYPLVLT